MARGETPSISNSQYSNNTLTYDQAVGDAGPSFSHGIAAGGFVETGSSAVRPYHADAIRGIIGRGLPGESLLDWSEDAVKHQAQNQVQQQQEEDMTTRLIQVFIVDPDPKVPLEKRLIYKGDQKLTDLNDSELFFEIDIKTILDEHNKVRGTIVDKTVKERTEYLEPTRIGKLKMNVTEIAKF